MLTDAEQALVQMTADLWNAYLLLPNEHGSDRPEFLAAIHDLQRHILSRPVRRAMNGDATGWVEPGFPVRGRS